MKKLLTIFLIFIMIFSFTACANDTEKEPNNKEDTQDNNDDDYEDIGKLQDGTYTALGDEWEYGQESSTIVIDEGQMVSVDLKRLTKDGKEVDYDNWTGEEINGKVYPNLKEFRKTMANQIIEQQTYNVDTIAGATTSTKNWKVATKKALKEASK